MRSNLAALELISGIGARFAKARESWVQATFSSI